MDMEDTTSAVGPPLLVVFKSRYLWNEAIFISHIHITDDGSELQKSLSLSFQPSAKCQPTFLCPLSTFLPRQKDEL